jgi:anti-sigma regulatory factor (Ser/Thr protein kinase)
MPSPTHGLIRHAPGTCPPDVASDLAVGVPGGCTVGTVGLGTRSVLTVPGRPDQVSAARAFARRLLGYQHSCVDTVVLLLSELVTNSVLHSRSAHADGHVTIAITHSRTVAFVEVTDDGSDIMPSLRPAGRGEHGYGLQLVEAYAARWGCSRNGAESATCWFEVRAGA